jgi:Asp-tRNA(Asn)/Glu-tRNA(Gln) amidotransferase A subunit family amidase
LSPAATKAADLAASYYERIAQMNPRLNVYLSLTKERALEQAARVDALAAKGDPLPPLAGIPVGIKDVLVMRALRPRRGRRFWRATGLPTTPRRWQAGSGGRGAAGQAELRRVCHGLLE